MTLSHCLAMFAWLQPRSMLLPAPIDPSTPCLMAACVGFATTGCTPDGANAKATKDCPTERVGTLLTLRGERFVEPLTVCRCLALYWHGISPPFWHRGTVLWQVWCVEPAGLLCLQRCFCAGSTTNSHLSTGALRSLS